MEYQAPDTAKTFKCDLTGPTERSAPTKDRHASNRPKRHQVSVGPQADYAADKDTEDSQRNSPIPATADKYDQLQPETNSHKFSQSNDL